MDGATLEARIERIREGLREVAARGGAVFGAEAHGFRLGPPLPEAEVAAFEARHGVRLPAEYRAFLTRLGDGGAGPAYGLLALARAAGGGNGPGPAELLAEPFPYTARIDPYEEDPACIAVLDAEERGELSGEEARRRLRRRFAGTVALCDEGCGYLHFLVVTGPEAGRVWLDAEAGDGGLVPLGVGFLAWYERWLEDARTGGRGTWWLGPPVPPPA